MMSERSRTLTCGRLAALLAGLHSISAAGAFIQSEALLQGLQWASAQPKGLGKQHSAFARIAPPLSDCRTRWPLHLSMLPEDAVMLLSMPDPLLLQHPELALLFPAGILALFPVELAHVIIRLVQV